MPLKSHPVSAQEGETSQTLKKQRAPRCFRSVAFPNFRWNPRVSHRASQLLFVIFLPQLQPRNLRIWFQRSARQTVLCEELPHHPGWFHPGQPEVQALKTVAEALMLDPELVQNRGV